MALPMNATPIYTLQIPSTNKEFKYRPFLVKDEKALLAAQQSEDQLVMVDTVRDVIRSCAKSEIDIDALASFDIEYIFLKLRAVSVGEMVELVFQCDEDHGEDNEKAQSKVFIDLNKVAIKSDKKVDPKIPLFGDVGVVMKYPTFETMKQLQETDKAEPDQVFDVVTSCIEYVYSADEIFYAKDQSKEELYEFLNNLTSEQFVKIQEFFNNMPKLSIDVEYKCPVCGKQHNKVLEGLQSFF